MKKMLFNKIIAFLLIVNTSLFIITFSLSFVILFRPFYYYQINSLDLVNKTGYAYDEIKEAYDDTLDYLVFNKLFSTGNLKYSMEGKGHFKDCKVLFNLNFIVLGITGIILIIKKIIFNKIELFNFNISFWSSCLNLLLFLGIVTVSLIVGFDKCFDVFHKIFFTGKNDWLLNPDTDEIIKILPEQYFMNVAILFISIVSLISIVIIIREIYHKKIK